MENFKNYKEYYINTKTWRESDRIATYNKLLKMSKNEVEALEDWQKNRLAENLTNKQAEALKNNDLQELKKLLKRHKDRAKKQLQEAKEEALKSYEDIKALKGIKNATFEIVWNQSRGVYGYQCRCYAKVLYNKGHYDYIEGDTTGGCGYDKPSSALSYALNKCGKILLINNGTKILKSDERHYKYYACENLYFSYGVGINSYINMFEAFGYKTKVLYHHNEDITITIEKGGRK